MAQLGYALIPESLEVALRAADIDWDNASNASCREYLIVVGYSPARAPALHEVAP